MWMCSSRSPAVFFIKRDDVYILNKALLYVTVRMGPPCSMPLCLWPLTLNGRLTPLVCPGMVVVM
jgi:hypothetical protein